MYDYSLSLDAIGVQGEAFFLLTQKDRFVQKMQIEIFNNSQG